MVSLQSHQKIEVNLFWYSWVPDEIVLKLDAISCWIFRVISKYIGTSNFVIEKQLGLFALCRMRRNAEPLFSAGRKELFAGWFFAVKAAKLRNTDKQTTRKLEELAYMCGWIFRLVTPGKRFFGRQERASVARVNHHPARLEMHIEVCSYRVTCSILWSKRSPPPESWQLLAGAASFCRQRKKIFC